jgi:hypothetical protein
MRVFLLFVFQSSLSKELYTNPNLNSVKDILNIFLQHWLPFRPNLLERNISKCKSHTDQFRRRQSLIPRSCQSSFSLFCLHHLSFISITPSLLPCPDNFYSSSSFLLYSSQTFPSYYLPKFLPPLMYRIIRPTSVISY